MEIIRKHWWLILILWAVAGLIIYRLMGVMPSLPPILYWIIVCVFAALVFGLTSAGVLYANGKRLLYQHRQQVAQAHLQSISQVVGKSCRDCGMKIVMADQAQRCTNCRQVLCLSCAPDLPCRRCLRR